MSSRAPAHADPRDLSGRTVAITGASPGSLGFATARALASWGASVFISTRQNTLASVEALRAEVPGASIEGHELDLVDARSTTAYAGWLGDRSAGLDVLINNAGVHLDLRSKWKEPTLTADGHEIHWRTNYLGSAHLTHLLRPALLKSAVETGNARVVNVVSKLHGRVRNRQLFESIVPYDSWTAYGASKLAMMHAARELDRVHGTEGLHAYSLHPGSVYTKIADKGLANSRILGALRHGLAPLERRTLLTPIQGAQTTLYCATAADLAGGAYYRDCRPAEPSLELADSAFSRALADKTEAWIASL